MKIPADSITNQNAMQIVQAGNAAIQSGDAVIDLSGVRRCDTAAVACVLSWRRLARLTNTRLQLIALPEDLRSLANLYGVQALVDGV